MPPAVLMVVACGGEPADSFVTSAATTDTIARATRPEKSAVTVLLQSTTTAPASPRFPVDKFASERNAMVRQQIAERDVTDSATLAAMRRIPRHQFVPQGEERFAYLDRPHPIGHGQTISQPYIVGYMTEMLRLTPGSRVLEIGTGSGYQAAVLAEIAASVVSIEIVEPLARSAAKRLGDLGYRNVTVVFGDGYFGWEALAPYDAIIVTAAAEHVPPPLLAQLKPGGRMVIPVGAAGWTQNLILVQKDEAGKVRTRNLLPVAFVPLTRAKQ